MAYDVSLHFGLARRFTALCGIASTLAGCAFTETSTSLRFVPSAPTHRLRLTRADASPLASTFRQEGHTIVGQLALTDACSVESTQILRQQEVTDTHTRRGATVAWIVTGAVLTAVGTSLLVASTAANSEVSCGNGDTPRSGDKCYSESGFFREAGVSALLTGLVPVVTGSYFLAQKPRVVMKDLAAKEVKNTSGPAPCGSTVTLVGLTAAVELPGNGRWLGQAAADGSLRIDINPNIPLPDNTTLRVVVDAVPASLAGLVSPGALLGELTVQRGVASLNPGKANARKQGNLQRSARNASLP